MSIYEGLSDVERLLEGECAVVGSKFLLSSRHYLLQASDILFRPRSIHDDIVICAASRPPLTLVNHFPALESQILIIPRPEKLEGGHQRCEGIPISAPVCLQIHLVANWPFLCRPNASWAKHQRSHGSTQRPGSPAAVRQLDPWAVLDAVATNYNLWHGDEGYALQWALQKRKKRLVSCLLSANGSIDTVHSLSENSVPVQRHCFFETGLERGRNLTHLAGVVGHPTVLLSGE